MNKFIKTSLFFIATFIIFFSNTQNIKAENEFTTDVNVTYRVGNNGVTQVDHAISLTNNLSDIYAKSYVFNLENIKTSNVTALENNVPLKTEIAKDGLTTSIKIFFDNAVVGKGETRRFNIIYENGEFAQKTGEVWEVSVPKLSDNSNFRDFTVTLIVPSSFGLEAYLSPIPSSKYETDTEKVYTFSKNIISDIGVTAGFGAFQVFTFSLNYHLENPLAKSAYEEIAFPPDTNLQKVYLTSLSTIPDNVYLDSDGNWIAKYILKPRERLDVTVGGIVQIFSGPRPFFPPSEETLNKALLPSAYWQTNDPKIVELAQKYKTPKAIYDFVSSSLSYNYDKVAPDIDRLGALEALNNPANSLCMEYTDLFVAIARAAGIPAREINGYAYTENPEIQPLSLVADVLHSWPEYWDFDKSQWIQIDPTWASTTKGVDFFNKLDLRHFTFVIHGADAERPYTPGSYKLGPNPQKDVFVNFGQLPELQSPQPTLEYETVQHIPFMPVVYNIKVFNPGPSSLYNTRAEIIFDNKVVEYKEIEVLPPFGNTTFEVKIPFSLLGKDTPNIASVRVLNTSVNLSTFKNRAVTDSFIVFSVLIFIIVFALIIKLKKGFILNFVSKVKTLPKKIFKNGPQD